MTSDDVKAGQLVVVTKHLCGSDDCGYSMNGHPFRVVVVSLPFAVLENQADGKRQPIDLREWQLSRVSAAYVRALLGSRVAPSVEPSVRCDDHVRCVRCGDRMVQRLVTPRIWRWWCEKCLSAGELVEAKS